MGSGSALEVVLHDYALYKSTFTLLYFTLLYLVPFASYLTLNNTMVLCALIQLYFCRAMLCISAAYAVVRCPFVCPFVCLSICLSVTFVYVVETNKHIFNFFTVG